MAGAYEIVMESRKELVDKVVEMMKKGSVLTAAEWDREALRPYNPLSGVQYKGGNRFRLMEAVINHEYTDPRWGTFLQFKEKGYYPKKGEHGILCEKWIFTREVKQKDENGEEKKVVEHLEKPIVSYFKVFNCEQIQDFPKFEPRKMEKQELGELIEDLTTVSECPVKEYAQERAFYRPGEDKIYLPLRSYFKDEESFAKTLLHEMGHSTGHPSRLNREFGGAFGSPAYAKEELCAELGALFTEVDLGIQLEGEHYQDHSNYLASWIGALEHDYNELFRACAQAEKISERIVGNYTRKLNKELSDFKEVIPERQEVIAVPEGIVARKPYTRKGR